MKPAIVLSTHVMGLSVIRGLGIMGVPVVAVCYDRQDMGYVSKYVKEIIFAPAPDKHEDQFVDVLVKAAERFGGGILMPANDATLVAASRNKRLLEQYYTVACTDWEITEKVIDKQYTYALADAIGVPAPKRVVPHSVEDVKLFAQTAQYPCLVKPTQVHRYFALFKEKMVKVNDFDHMLAAYKRVADTGLEVMLQEWIPGDDAHGVSYHSYFWNSEALLEFTAAGLRKAPPEIGSPRLMLSMDIPEVIEPGRKILQALGYYGFSCTEFKQDSRDGVYKLMEVNGRHSMAESLDRRCGINFPWLEYKHLMQGEVPSPTSFQTGVYWIHLTTDVAYSLKYRKQERYSLKQYIEPYLRPRTFAILDLRDPRPFFQRGLDAVRRAVASGRTKVRHSDRPDAEAETARLARQG